MSSKDKENKAMQDRLKNFFKGRANTGGNFPMTVNYIITAELERDIGCSTPLYKRLKVIKDLGEKVLNNRVENPGVERIWKSVRDLLHRDQLRETRHSTFSFLRNLVQGQYEQLTIMRAVLFRFIREHDIAEDWQPRFELLQTLTENGKDIRCFEEEIGRFLLEWMSKLECPLQIQQFLELIVNLVKYNAAYLDNDVVCDIVDNCCYLCCYSGVSEVVLTCLQVLETVVCYTIFPRPVLQTFVASLCRTVNIEHYCQISWKIMRNMLGTDLGHAVLYETVEVVLNGGMADAGLTRGAVFYINMALWGPKRVTTLKATHTSVLPAFLKALEGEHSVVTYEVILALQSLIARHGSELHETPWEMIFSILQRIIAQVDRQPSPNKLIESHLHDLITAIEQLNEQRHFNGNVASLYALVDSCGHMRHESSVLKLINWLASQLTPMHQDWLGQMSDLLERYCRLEKRVTVRTHTLNVVHGLVQNNRKLYEEELLERVVLPHVQQSALDADPDIRLLTAQLLVELAINCQSKAFVDLLNVMEKLLNRPFDLYVTNDPISLPPDPKTVTDIRTVLEGLIRIFHLKLLQLPSSHAVHTYLILLGHLERHYARPSLFQHHPSIRMKILELFLSARANKQCHIGFCYDSSDNALMGAVSLRVKPVYSPYVCVEGGTVLSSDGTAKVIGSHSPSAGANHQIISFVSIRKACKLIIQCLTQERDWIVLHLVLREIPNVMQNKPLILSKETNEIDMLASALCNMIIDNTFENLRYPPGLKMTNSDFHGHVLPVLVSLAPYHLNLDPTTQVIIIKYLIKYGLVTRQAQQSIAALTIYTLETRDTMVKMLPEVMLKISQTSDTNQIAVPLLEFLSTLTRLPKMFASFVADQYLSVFAILLPYTNPSRYNHYVVSLAHHIIAAWFLKCRLHYRRDFVKYIINGLHNYVLMPFEEAKFSRRNDFSLNMNEDSSNRMRSSSLGSRGREPVSRNALSGAELGFRSAASASAAFHLELSETCVDLLARYTFSPCSIRPRRGPTADFMLSGGQSCTWVVGHEVVTITTSGCQQNSLRHGLCDRCLALCKQHMDFTSSPGFLGGTTDMTELRGDAHNNEIKRQNSSENRSDALLMSSPKASSDGGDTQAQLSLKLENLAKQEERGGGGGIWLRGTCVCWCSGWVEVHVRRPSGDVSWVMRMQNQMNFDSMLESPLNDIIGLLAPSIQGGTHFLGQASSILNMSSSRSSGLGDSRNDILSDTDPRSRSGSSSSQHKSTQYSPGAAAPSLQPPPPPSSDLQKSSSDSVVAPGGTTVEKKPPHASTHCIVPTGTNTQQNRGHMGTEPIDIPGSPQRQSSSSTTTDDDENIVPPFVDQGKFRHPVRRSNSSPEMSSSWKLPFQQRESADTADADLAPPEPDSTPPSTIDMILLPSVEPTVPLAHHHQKKTGKNKDMRVSCEAIPEEMFSSGGTPPSLPSSQHVVQHATQHVAQHTVHPHLMTYNSDPGQQEGQVAPATQQNITTVSSDTALNTLANKSTNDLIRQSNSHKSEVKVMAKPPQSPAPTSPGRSARGSVQIQLGSASVKPSGVTLKLQDKGQDRDDLPPLSRSKRSNTISVMSPTRKRRDNPSPKPREPGVRPACGGGVTPAFVMLQLYHNINVNARARAYQTSAQQQGGSGSGGAREWEDLPLLVSGVSHERTVKNLDHIPPVETYRVGVLYVGPGQTDETQILRNEFGSLRYAEFLRDLGTLIALEDTEKHGLYLNVEKGGKDGHFAYVWQDDIMQVHFHVATLMPNSANDPTANEKRKHIGNDYVSIVYNDSGLDFNINTIKGQFNFCIVMIEPLEHGINRVTIKTKEGRIDSKFVLQTECKVISDQSVALLARQLALHCTLASLISRSLNDSKHIPYASNSLERLRVIKRLRSRLIQEREARQDTSYTVPCPADVNRQRNMDDFTEYT